VDRHPDLVEQLASLAISKPHVACSVPARWVRPKLLGVVRFCGWRQGGVWRDPFLVGSLVD
jgi:hypothetical protein